jgi:uncharacterized protein HemY
MLFSALRMQRPGLPDHLNGNGPHIKLLFDALHKVYQELLMRCIINDSAWNTLLSPFPQSKKAGKLNDKSRTTIKLTQSALRQNVRDTLLIAAKRIQQTYTPSRLKCMQQQLQVCQDKDMYMFAIRGLTT